MIGIFGSGWAFVVVFCDSVKEVRGRVTAYSRALQKEAIAASRFPKPGGLTTWSWCRWPGVVDVAVVIGSVFCLRSVDGTKDKQLRVASALRPAGATKHAVNT